MDISPSQWLSMPRTERQRLIKELEAGQAEFDYINLVNAGKLGVNASLGLHFDTAIFGRDSLQVAEDLLDSHQNLARTIIHSLASLQGVKYDPTSEEEPGKIHHEYRAKIFNDQPIPEISLNLMRRLQQTWGGVNTDSMRYYGSYDATPLYIRLVGSYIQRYGHGFLNEIYNGLDGEKRIADSLRAATLWLINKIVSSPWILLEYKRLNWESGIKNQVWKDSDTSYLHLDGSVANHDSGIASAELQGYAYDALLIACQYVARNDKERKDWHELAVQLQQQTIERLWMEETKFFAQGLDRSPQGHTRKIQSLTSNGGLLLDSNLLNDLSPDKRQTYVNGIVATITSSEFITPVGIRSRALRYKQMPGFIDYHGSYTVWPKETYAIARGLRRFGEDKQAAILEANILDGVMQAGEFYEFFYVNDTGNVWYDREVAVQHFKDIGLGKNIATPESGQAWTISAVISILRRRKTMPNQK